MRKWSLFITLAIFIFVFSGCSSPKPSASIDTSTPSTPTAETQTETSKAEPEVDVNAGKKKYKDRVISIGNMHYPPFETVIDGVHSGPGIDTMKEAFDRMGYAYEIQEKHWDSMIRMIEGGSMDVIIDVYVTPEREQFMDYSKVPYGVFPQALFARKDSGIVFDGNLESLTNYSIGITRGYAYGPKLDPLIASKALKFEMSDDAKTIFRKLKDKRLDLVADTPFTGEALLSELGINDRVVMLSPYFDNLFSYIAFSKANNMTDLRDEYDKTMVEIFEDGTLKKIYDKYNMGDIADAMIQEHNRTKKN